MQGGKVRMLTHACSHNPTRNIDATIAITRLAMHCICGVMFDLVICKCRSRNMVMHDTKCPY